MAEKSATATIEKPAEKNVPAAPAAPKVKFDTSNLKSSYANVCNATCTREELVLNFGINQGWERAANDVMDVQLTHRIILSPFAAKRMVDLLNKLMTDYEARYGELK